MNGLLKSRKFWLAVFDACTSTLLLLVGAFVPEQADLIKTIVGFWQIPFVLLITGITVEDAAQKAQQAALLAQKFGRPD